MKFRNVLLALGFVSTLSLSKNAYTSFAQPYSTVIRNVGTKKISDSVIIFNKRRLTAGWVSPGNYKVNENPSAPIPDKAIVSWQRENGTVYEREIEIKSKLTKLLTQQEYYIIVDIDDSNDANLRVVVCNTNEPCLNKILSK